jgi:hypothetical protein
MRTITAMVEPLCGDCLRFNQNLPVLLLSSKKGQKLFTYSPLPVSNWPVALLFSLSESMG